MISTSVAEAAQCLKQGHVLAYPTEAVWGLGCDPFNEQAFLEILRLKQRPIEKGVILLAAQIAQVEHLLKPLTAHCAMPLTVLLSRPVPILQEKTLPAPFRKPANIFPAR